MQVTVWRKGRKAQHLMTIAAEGEQNNRLENKESLFFTKVQRRNRSPAFAGVSRLTLDDAVTRAHFPFLLPGQGLSRLPSSDSPTLSTPVLFVVSIKKHLGRPISSPKPLFAPPFSPRTRCQHDTRSLLPRPKCGNCSRRRRTPLALPS